MRQTLWKLILLTTIIFFIVVFTIFVPLNDLDSSSLLFTEQNGDICSGKLASQRSSYEAEITYLRDQIKSLQEELVYAKLSNSLNTPKSESDECLRKLGFDNKLSKTEVISGLTYGSETLVEPFITFNMWHQYPVESGGHKKLGDKINGYKRHEIDEVIDTAISSLNQNKNATFLWRRDHFTEGIYRHFNSIGTHFELNFVSDDNADRVVLFRPEGLPVYIRRKAVENYQRINIVVPLTSDKRQEFVHFLRNFEGLISKRQDLFLTLVYFAGTVKDLLSEFQPFILRNKFTSYKIELVSDRNFSRGQALNVGIKSWQGADDPLIFLCDVDTIFNEDLLKRCTTYTEKGRSVYYPIVFSLYNPQVIEQYLNIKFTTLYDQLKVNTDYGFWRDFGFGMACMYRSDYEAVGGFDLNLSSWGEEDVRLYRKFAMSNLTLYRATDPGIFHVWHHKKCDPTWTDHLYRECIQSKALNEGSQMQLGYMLLKDEISRKDVRPKNR